MLAAAGAARAGPGILGTWEPYSDTVIGAGAMTVTESAVRFDNGDAAQLVPLDVPNAFEVVAPRGESFRGCGEDPIRYIAFVPIDPVYPRDAPMIARIDYAAGARPVAPESRDLLAVMDRAGPLCALSVYVRP